MWLDLIAFIGICFLIVACIFNKNGKTFMSFGLSGAFLVIAITPVIWFNVGQQYFDYNYSGLERPARQNCDIMTSADDRRECNIQESSITHLYFGVPTPEMLAKH